jgi:predicted Zn-dependent peptidase
LCVAGAFDSSELQSAVEELFGPMRAGHAIDPVRAPRGEASKRFAYVVDPGSQTDVRLSFHTPGVASAEAPTLLLLARVLDDGLSTRMHQTICEERGLAYEAFAGNDSFEECGVFDFGASVEHKKAPLLVESVLELIEALRREPPTEEELDKAKRRYWWDLQTVRDDPEDTAHFVGSSVLFGLPEKLRNVAEQAGRVTPHDIQQTVRRYFHPSKAHLTCVGMVDDSLRHQLRRLIEA